MTAQRAQFLPNRGTSFACTVEGVMEDTIVGVLHALTAMGIYADRSTIIDEAVNAYCTAVSCVGAFTQRQIDTKLNAKPGRDQTPEAKQASLDAALTGLANAELDRLLSGREIKAVNGHFVLAPFALVSSAPSFL